MSRIGKIARLPEQIRLQINRRLQDGENGRDIIEWLNSTDEVKVILAANFAGRPITDGNLSEWKTGGYQDWQSQEIALAEARRIMEEGRELAKTGEGNLAEHLAAWIMGRYLLAVRNFNAKGDAAAEWKMLRELSHDLVAIRRGEQGAEWLRLEQERLQLLREKQNSDREKLKQEIREEDPPPKVLTPEERERRWCEIFGIDSDTHPMLRNRSSFSDPDPDPNLNLNPNPDPEVPPPPADAPTSSFSSISPIHPATPMSPVPPPEAPEITELRQLTEKAEKGDAASQHSLGTRYRDGFGVPRDWIKAREWLAKAASQRFGNAIRDLHVSDLRPIPGNSD